nr:Hsp70 family protein [Candidatus Sigynarchaeota archaeon]
MASNEDYCLGIDFGTTNSKMAYWFLETPTIIKDNLGNVNIPSVVHFKEDGTILVGDEAKQCLIPFPGRTIASVKRKMGTRHDYSIDDEKYPPEYVGALIFRKLMHVAKEQTGIEFKNVVISVPANYTDAQRYAIKDAAEIAGFNVKRMINEPTAAALAYGMQEASSKQKTVLIYDFGGGTFDVSILTVDGMFFNVEASSGINKCGGDDIDEKLVRYLGNIIRKDLGIEIDSNLKILQEIRTAAERAKIELSCSESANISIPFLSEKQDGSIVAFTHTLTRKILDGLISTLIQSTKQPVLDVIKFAGLTMDQIDDVILVGGTTKIPAVREFVHNLFKKVPLSGLDPHEVVALGAAITSAEGNNVVSGTKNEPIEISDVASHSFGVHVFPYDVEKIIEKNEKLPLRHSKLFSNYVDYTDVLDIEVFEGEEKTTKKENRLGSFLIDVVPKPSGCNKIEVSFNIGVEHGILDVTAKDLDTGLEKSVRLETRSRLTGPEKKKWIDRMHGGGYTTVIVHDKVQKTEITFYIDQRRPVFDILQRLQERKMLAGDKSDRKALFYKKNILQGQEKLADFITDTNEIRLDLKHVS